MMKKQLLSGIGSLLLSYSVTAAQGDLDNSYGTGGIVHTPAGDLVVGTQGMSNDRLLIGGIQSGITARFSRLLADGSPDNSFGVNGHQELSPGSLFGLSNFSHSDFAIAPTDKIVLTGYSVNNTTGVDGLVLRLNSDGSYDSSFAAGSGGVRLRSLPGLTGNTALSPRTLAVDNLGRIVVAARNNPGIILLRLNPNGSPDSSFGSNGQGYINIDFAPGNSYSQVPVSVNIHSNGDISVAGFAFVNSAQGFIARLDNNGTAISGFANNGQLLYPTPGDVVTAARVDNNDRLLVLYDSCSLSRFNSNGQLDNSFGTAGNASVPVTAPQQQHCRGLAIRPTGAPVISGTRILNSTNNAALIARFDNSGQLLNSFDNDGVRLVGQPDFIDNIDPNGYVFPTLKSDGYITTGLRELAGFHNFAALALEDTALNVTPRPANLGQRSHTGTNTWVSSNMMQVQDLAPNTEVVISVENGQYSINGLPYTSTPGRVNNGDLIVLRHQAQNCRNCITRSSLHIGGVPDSKNGGQLLGTAREYPFISSTGYLTISIEQPRRLERLLP